MHRREWKQLHGADLRQHDPGPGLQLPDRQFVGPDHEPRGQYVYTTGTDSDGNSWSQDSRRVGNTTYQSGYDSDGNSFNGTIRRSGSSVNYSGSDSDGNYYNKTCNSYGCY